MSKAKPLVVIPTFMSRPEDLKVLRDCVKSIRNTASDSVRIMVIDDASPDRELVKELSDTRLDKMIDIVSLQPVNRGFSRTVNVGLNTALEWGVDAVLVNADIKMLTPGWVRHCRKTTDPEGNRAAVVGALLVYPNGLIQHAGIYFSMLRRCFLHLYAFAPSNLPEALEKRVTPVTGAFQYIRHETLEKVGVYDPMFLLGHEDVDYCVRVFKAGMACVFNPNVRAIHYESLFRGRKTKRVREWEAKSFLYFARKYEHQSFSGLIP